MFMHPDNCSGIHSCSIVPVNFKAMINNEYVTIFAIESQVRQSEVDGGCHFYDRTLHFVDSIGRVSFFFIIMSEDNDAREDPESNYRIFTDTMPSNISAEISKRYRRCLYCGKIFEVNDAKRKFCLPAKGKKNSSCKMKYHADERKRLKNASYRASQKQYGD